MSHSQPILSITNLEVSYGTHRAVDDVSFEVQPGEIFGFLGPNGAGKTSTLSAVEGLIKPESGTIVVAGIDLRKDPLAAKAQIGVQLQSTSFQSELTLLELTRLYAGLYGVTISKEEVTNQLRVIGLEAEATKRFKQLSGGQQQRFSLLIATLHDPSLVLLDEPTAGLDPQSRRQLWERIEVIRTEEHSIVLTTHSMEEAQAVCDRIAIIDHGKIVALDTPDGLIKKHQDDPAVKQAARGKVTLEDVFIGLTGNQVRA